MAKYITTGAFEKVSSVTALYNAHKKTKLGKRYKNEVMEFEANLNCNLQEMHHRLEKGTFKLSGYITFYVTEPKRREIRCLHYKDRVLIRSITDNVIAPYFKDKFIYDNCACQKEKGTHFGLYRLERFMREHYNKYGAQGYVLKGDISNYFYSIDCAKLKEMLLPRVKDEKLKRLLEHIINDGSKDGIGIPLGNITSQWFALFYLDGLDRLVKEKLRIKHYSRYMDDFVLLSHDKEYLRQCLKEITELVGSLGLTLNHKTQILPLKNGVDYLGYHTYLTETGKVVRKIRQSSKKAMKRRLKVYQREYAAGNLELFDVRQRLVSWMAHANHGHTYHLQKKILSKAVFRRDVLEGEEK